MTEAMSGGLDESVEAAVLASARAEFERFGIRKSNVDDVANAAGVSRSTLYRRYPNKTVLLMAVAAQVLAESARTIDLATRGMPPKETVVEAFCAMAEELNSVPFYRTVLFADEVGKPLSVIRDIRASGTSAFAGRVATTLRRAGSTMPDDELTEVSQLLVRIAADLAQDPIPGVRPDDAEAIRRFATVHLTKLVD